MKVRAVIVAGLLGWPMGAHAQLVAGISSALVGSPSTPAGWHASPQIAPLFRLDVPAGALSMETAFAGFDHGLGLRAVSLTSRGALPLYGPFRLSASTAVDHDWTTGRIRRADSASVGISYRRGTAGSWLGAAVASARSPALLAGVWKQLGSRASLSVSSGIHSTMLPGAPRSGGVVVDSIYTDTGLVERITPGAAVAGRPRLSTWMESEARLGLSIGPVALDAAVGWRPPADSVQRGGWMNATATLRVSRSLALLLGGGTLPSPWVSRGSNVRYAQIGVRIAPIQAVRPAPPPAVRPTAGAFAVRERGAGEYVVQVRVPHARTVELSGDFDGWQPVRLSEVQPDVWEAAISVAPGTYRMNLRVDGESWIAPPGTPAVDDDFNGRVGLVVVR